MEGSRVRGRNRRRAVPVEVRKVGSPTELRHVVRLLREYAREVGVDLAEQGFDKEIRTLPGAYAPPLGGLWLAHVARRPAGCVGLRPWSRRIGEVKRLFVRNEFRGAGVGRALMDALLREAMALEYAHLRLDTLPSMKPARVLYARLGFRRIPPYYRSPFPGTAYFELALPRGPRHIPSPGARVEVTSSGRPLGWS